MNAGRLGWRIVTALSLAGLLVVAFPRAFRGAAPTEPVRVDVGIVASNPERTVAFYTEAIGLRELTRFLLSGPRARRMGLSSGDPLEIRVLAFDESPSTTRIKIIGVPGEPPDRQRDSEVSTLLGIRYVTVFVPDWLQTLRRLEGAGVEPARDVEIGGGTAPEVAVAIVRDPDGNVVELVGRKPDDAPK